MYYTLVKTIRYGSFHILTECGKCGLSFPVNGPLRTIECPHCLSERSIGEQVFADILGTLEEEYETLGEGEGNGVKSSGQHGTFRYTYLRRMPQCHGCKKPFDVEAIPIGSASIIECQNCQKRHSTFPAPTWLKNHVPTAIQCYGADLPPQYQAEHAALEIDQNVPEAIAMACPSCGGGLRVTSSWSRIHPCQYCEIEVFIPDAVWKRLHPVKIAHHWGVRFEGPVSRGQETQDELADLERAITSSLANVDSRMKQSLPRRWKDLQSYFTSAVRAVKLSGYDEKDIDKVIQRMYTSFKRRVYGQTLTSQMEKLLRSQNADRAILLLQNTRLWPKWIHWGIPLVLVAVGIVYVLLIKYSN